MHGPFSLSSMVRKVPGSRRGTALYSRGGVASSIASVDQSEARYRTTEHNGPARRGKAPCHQQPSPATESAVARTPASRVKVRRMLESLGHSPNPPTVVGDPAEHALDVEDKHVRVSDSILELIELHVPPELVPRLPGADEG